MTNIDTLLLIKGYGEPHEDRWQHHESDIARSRGMRVLYPQEIPGLQGTAIPTREDVRQFIIELLEQEGVEPEKLLTLPHSLGGNVWMEVLRHRAEFRDALTRFIATPWEKLADYPELDKFLPETEVPLTVEQKGNILVVGSGDDPIIKEHPMTFADNLGVKYALNMGAGHYMPRSLYENGDFGDYGRTWITARTKLNMPY